MKRNFNTPFNEKYSEYMKKIHLNILEVGEFVR